MNLTSQYVSIRAESWQPVVNRGDRQEECPGKPPNTSLS
jgi:hypothetical protein